MSEIDRFIISELLKVEGEELARSHSAEWADGFLAGVKLMGDYIDQMNLQVIKEIKELKEEL